SGGRASGRNAALGRFAAMSVSAAAAARVSGAGAAAAGTPPDAASATAGTPSAGVGGRSRSSRAALRRPSVSVMRPSVGASGAAVPVATWNNASTCSAVIPGFKVKVRTPRAYNKPASSAICVFRGSNCWPCQCRPVAPIFHSTVPTAASGGRVSPTWRSASWTAGWVGGYSRVRRNVVPIAPSARSTPVVSVVMPQLSGPRREYGITAVRSRRSLQSLDRFHLVRRQPPVLALGESSQAHRAIGDAVQPFDLEPERLGQPSHDALAALGEGELDLEPPPLRAHAKLHYGHRPPVERRRARERRAPRRSAVAVRPQPVGA